MKRVAFVDLTSNSWLGGINYFKNLLIAISKLDTKKIQPILFFGTKEDKKTINYFSSYGEIVQSKILDKDNFWGILNAVSMRLLNWSFSLERLFIENNIDVVSHSRFITNNKKIKTINWIVDFQHVHLPKMFSIIDRLYKDILFTRYAKYSDLVILSSFNALKDYKKIYPKYIKKAFVLHFASQISESTEKCTNIAKVKKKYGFEGKYFFLPNQLWKHKNHMVVLEAVNYLKERGKKVKVVCTGNMNDYRNSTYANEIKEYLRTHKLENDIRFLGLINAEEFLTLFKNSLAVINPSLFEGWSTTVEEAKSLNKDIILSDIEVHREQNPNRGVYFRPNDHVALAQILLEKWNMNFNTNTDLKSNDIHRVEKGTIRFAKDYENIVTSI